MDSERLVRRIIKDHRALLLKRARRNRLLTEAAVAATSQFPYGSPLPDYILRYDEAHEYSNADMMDFYLASHRMTVEEVRQFIMRDALCYPYGHSLVDHTRTNVLRPGRPWTLADVLYDWWYGERRTAKQLIALDRLYAGTAWRLNIHDLMVENDCLVDPATFTWRDRLGVRISNLFARWDRRLITRLRKRQDLLEARLLRTL